MLVRLQVGGSQSVPDHVHERVELGAADDPIARVRALMRRPLKSRVHYAWLVLATSTLAVFGSLGLARFGYTVVLPSMQAGLGFDNTQAGGLATANLIGYSALAVLGGALASRFGPRLVVTAGLITAGLAMLFTGLVGCLLYTSPSPRDGLLSRMRASA